MKKYCKNCKYIDPPRRIGFGLGYFWGNCRKNHKWSWDEDIHCIDFERSVLRTVWNAIMQG